MQNNKKTARRGLLARAGLLGLQTVYLALEVTALWIVMGIAEYPAFWSLYAVAAVVASMTGTALLPVIRRYEGWLERAEEKEENCCENDHHAGRCAG